jgi:hypothetical protein
VNHGTVQTLNQPALFAGRIQRIAKTTIALLVAIARNASIPASPGGWLMFGMDMVALVTAAIAGALGGLVGALIAGKVAQKNTMIRTAIIIAGITGFSVMGRPILAPYVEHIAGPWMRTSQFDALYGSEIEASLKKVPAFERIFREHPDVEKKFRDAARKAFEQGGAPNLRAKASSIGSDVLGDALLLYLPGARAEDLVLFAVTMSDILTAMNDRDPELCIIYQFGTQLGQPLDSARLQAVIGETGQRRLLETMNTIVVNAGDNPVPHDRTRGAREVANIAERHAPLLTGSSAEVAAGERLHKDIAEAKAACSFATAMFRDLATMDPKSAELIMRQLYAPPPADALDP